MRRLRLPIFTPCSMTRDVQSGHHFPDSLLAVQAAIAGQGVAIVSLVLIAEHFRPVCSQCRFR